jgi:RsiW-degrading membrane proteinase PrsW (M82 family)
METLKLLALCSAPGLAIGIYIFWRDKYDKRELRLMLGCFVLGILSLGLTLLLSRMMRWIAAPDTNSIHGLAIYAFVYVATLEEFSKFLFLTTYAFPKKEFNAPYNGITYSVMIGMGFAAVESVIYIFNQVNYNTSFYVGVIRLFTAVPAHAAMAVMMGYFAGLAKLKKRKTLYIITGLITAIVFHGFYDFFLFIGNYPFIFIGALTSLALCIWFSVKAVKLHRHNLQEINSAAPQQ